MIYHGFLDPFFQILASLIFPASLEAIVEMRGYGRILSGLGSLRIPFSYVLCPARMSLKDA
jgi:hypothetical protein